MFISVWEQPLTPLEVISKHLSRCPRGRFPSGLASTNQFPLIFLPTIFFSSLMLLTWPNNFCWRSSTSSTDESFSFSRIFWLRTRPLRNFIWILLRNNHLWCTLLVYCSRSVQLSGPYSKTGRNVVLNITNFVLLFSFFPMAVKRIWQSIPIGFFTPLCVSTCPFLSLFTTIRYRSLFICLI